MVDWASLIIGSVGAITGVVSLLWHISNSQSKVVIDRLSFNRVRDHQFQDKEVVAVSVTLRNKSNRSTTIESAGVEIGHHLEEFIRPSDTNNISPNSSRKFDFRIKLKSEEFNRILEKKPVKLGVTIIHTFGTLKKGGLTDFSRDSLLSL